MELLFILQSWFNRFSYWFTDRFGCSALYKGLGFGAMGSLSKMLRIRTQHSISPVVNGVLVDLPAPNKSCFLGNFGSLLGACLVIQLITGLFLAMHYCPDVNLAFDSISHILSDVNYGFMLKYIHANGASLFFLCVYIHIGRGLYYGRYMNMDVWNIGVII